MRSSIAAIHVAKNQLGLDDDLYRAKLLKITGKASTKDMTEAERQHVLTVFRNEGFSPASNTRRPNGRRQLSGKFAKKLQALWIAAYNLGIVRNRDDDALEAFVTRQTGIAAERFLHHADDAAKVIEALKKWMAREAGVDWSADVLVAPHLRSDGYRIARAQWEIISPQGPSDFWPTVTDLISREPPNRDLSDRDWIVVMNLFGDRIRQMRRSGQSHV